MGTKFEEQLTCVEQLLERAEKERDGVVDTRGSDIREVVALNDKVDGLKERVRECRDAVNAQINCSLASESLVDMADTEIGKYLADRHFKMIDGLQDLCDGDWIANLIGN